jgi:16S rRNA (adenine1518-N6/adenine1519-N6)-dimethyltransferase
LQNPPPLREIIKRYGIGAQKSLGQHFLLDPNLCSRIARSTGKLEKINVIEIGPGPGGLTRALLDNGAKSVTAIEKDSRCVKALAELSAIHPGRLKVIEANALKINIVALTPKPRSIIANLPYNVATPLLLGWLYQINEFENLALMFQKEVAERLVAQPGSKSYGRLSIITQWLCKTKYNFEISKQAFTPSPKVESSIITLTPRAQPLVPATRESLEIVTAMAFGQRRKMIRSSLKALNLKFTDLGIKPTARAEELTVEQFCSIANSITDLSPYRGQISLTQPDGHASGVQR